MPSGGFDVSDDSTQVPKVQINILPNFCGQPIYKV